MDARAWITLGLYLFSVSIIFLWVYIRNLLKERDRKNAEEAVENFRRDLIIYLSRYRAYKGTPLEDTLMPLNEYYLELSEYIDNIVLWRNRSYRIVMNKIFKSRLDELSDFDKEDIICFLEDLKK